MKVLEFRVRLPMTVEEYQVAQLYSVAEASKNETGGGDGIEVKVNEPFTDDNYKPPDPLLYGHTTGQYTHKIYHIENKVPYLIRKCALKGSLHFHEKAWNAFPYCRTVITNEYMKDCFFLKIETMHCMDDGSQENVHQLSPDMLAKRKIDFIDIAKDKIKDYKKEEDPTLYKSVKTGRGPLVGDDWHLKTQPLMTAYKLVTYNFKWFGLQGSVENFIQTAERRIFLNFHRQLFCWTDLWFGLTMEDIRRIEDETQKTLDEFRTNKCRGLQGTIEVAGK